MTQIIIEDFELFLNFSNDFERVNAELPELINRFKESPSLQNKNYLLSKTKNLASQAQFVGLQVVNPLFDALFKLIDAIEPDDLFISEDVWTLIRRIFSSLSSNLINWENRIKQSNNDTKPDLCWDIDPELSSKLLSIDLENLGLSETGTVDEDEIDTNEIVSKYLKEGTDLISDLRIHLNESQESGFEVKRLRHTLTMIKGDTDVLMDFGFNQYPASHPIHLIQQFSSEMLKIIDFLIQQDLRLTSSIADHFNSCIDEIEELFLKFNEPGMVNKESGKLLDQLKLFQKDLGKTSHTEAPNETTEESDHIPKKNLERKAEPEQTFLPIKLERIEDLGNLIGELVVAKNAFNNLRALILESEKQKTIEFLKKTEDSFHRILGDLDSVVMKMRMQKVKTLFQRFPRMIRDLSKKMNKEIELQFSGEDTEIDNRILRAVTDPMMHLVRNSLDHGIETSEEREKKGKEKKGIIQLSAKNRDGRSIIEIFDDGKGLNPDLLKEKAITKGLIGKDESKKLSEKEGLELIFMPGFSTADQVSEVSGRGVGMDVVMTSVQDINGKIEIESQVGEFTRIILSLPLTISVSKGLKVSFDNTPYLIPMDDILKMTVVNQKEIHSSQDKVFIKLDNKIYPILPVNNLLGYDSPVDSENNDINLVVVKSDNQAAAIVVDSILGIEDIVVKPLPEITLSFKKLYSGCSILSDGSVVLILNTNQCIKTGGFVDDHIK